MGRSRNSAAEVLTSIGVALSFQRGQYVFPMDKNVHAILGPAAS